MLVLARADAGGRPLRLVDLYLEEMVADCRRAVEVLATERGVTIESGASPEIPFRGDEDLLRQLVVNVLQNAVQHTRRVARSRSRCAGTPASSGFASAIPAPGFRPGISERIFDRFVQLDPARRGRGAGLGPADRAMDCRGARRHARCWNPAVPAGPRFA